MADRPVPDEDEKTQDVEITPEMVAAGLSAFEWHSESVDPTFLVGQIYSAMELARLQGRQQRLGCLNPR